jgi:K+-transporting ATPase ATPase A chain
MNLFSWLQLIFYFVVLLALAKPLGTYMARVYQGEHTSLERVLAPVERFIYRVSGVRPDEEMNGKIYAIAAMLFNALGLLFLDAL